MVVDKERKIIITKIILILKSNVRNNWLKVWKKPRNFLSFSNILYYEKWLKILKRLRKKKIEIKRIIFYYIFHKKAVIMKDNEMRIKEMGLADSFGMMALIMKY